MGKETTGLRRTFTPQFKKDAVRLVVAEGKRLTEVAAHLGIARSLLQRWREQLSSRLASEVFRGHGRVTGQAAKIRELEKLPATLPSPLLHNRTARARVCSGGQPCLFSHP